MGPRLRWLTGLVLVASSHTQQFFTPVRGLQRSGTNLMQSIFDTCEQRACLRSCDSGHCPKTSRRPGPCCAPGVTRSGEPLPVIDHVSDHVRDTICHKHFLFKTDTPYAKVDRSIDASADTVADLDRLSSYDGNATYVVVIKHPFAWALSACRFWKCDRKDDGHGGIYEFVRIWNEYVGLWVKLRREAPARILLLRYEALLADPAAALRPVADRTDGASAACLGRLAARLDANGTLENDAGERVTVNMSPSESWSSKRKYYGDCDYLRAPTGIDLAAGGANEFAVSFPQFIATANATVDRDVLEGAGYARDPWSDCKTDADAVVAAYAAAAAERRTKPQPRKPHPRGPAAS